MRYISKSVQADLKKKLVLLAGPRQCGKTTFAKSLMDKNSIYLNWDVVGDRKIIRQIAWAKSASLLILDELHKAPKWKNYLKGIIDEFHNKPPILVTGSARLDLFRKAGDALTGRYFFYRLHPFDPAEIHQLYPRLSHDEIIKRMLETGGFPEAFLDPKIAMRLRNDRVELVVKEDIKDLTKISSVTGAIDLIELLRERVGKPINYDSLSQDLGCSPPTAKNWVQILEKLYLVFLLRPYAPSGSAISIRKETRVYFFDCASAYDVTLGAQLENLVACSLLKFVNFKKDTTGENWDLYYLRDKQKREVDFVVTKNRRVEKLVEVKKSDDAIGLGLRYYHEKLRPKETLQLVLQLDRPQERNGIKILPLGNWLIDALWNQE